MEQVEAATEAIPEGMLEDAEESLRAKPKRRRRHPDRRTGADRVAVADSAATPPSRRRCRSG
jgi:hypothetical protein